MGIKIKQALKKYIPKQPVKVSLFIVGAQKSGSSALHNYLVKHPNIVGGNKKELNFFNHPEKYNKGLKWYHAQFQSPLFYKTSAKIYLDSTPQYLSDLTVAEKIYNYNPNSKIVILLREPVSRAYSAWNMYKQFSELSNQKKKSLLKNHIKEKQISNFRALINLVPFYTFDEYVSKEIENGNLNDFYPNIIKRGIYVEQVKPYIDLFGLDQVLIFESSFFKKNKLKVTNEILESIGLIDLPLKEENLSQVHSRTYDTPINKFTKEELIAFYKPYNEKLFKLINQKFDW